MNRVIAAIEEGRCVLAIGGAALCKPDVLAELRRRAVPAVALGGATVNPAVAPSAEALAPALLHEGGILVLVEPDPSVDGQALGQLARLVSEGAHKPRLLIAAKAFNPFALPLELRLLKLQQIKARAVDFLAGLPVRTLQEALAAQKRSSRKKPELQPRAPQPVWVGRQEELAALEELLSAEGGPIIVTGPRGVGRRWLVERALADGGLKRLPDLNLGAGSGADVLLARFAVIGEEVGDGRLDGALQAARRPVPAELAKLVAETAAHEDLGDKVMVVHGLDRLLDRRSGGLVRNGRLEMILRALLTSRPALRLVFVAEQVPTFYRQGQAVHLRVLSVAGLKGRELFDLYSAWRCPEFPRDRFGPIFERTHGHPMANRFLAVAVREEAETLGDVVRAVDTLIEQPKFLCASAIGDLEAIRRHIKRKVSELDKDLRGALARLALLREPGGPDELGVLGVSRQQRIALLSAGLLDQTPSGGERRYYVHPLVAEHLAGREINDFEALEALGRHYLDQSRKIRDGGERLGGLALAQEANRLLTEARHGRQRVRLPWPDNDAIEHSVRGLLRRRQPRLYDVARSRIGDGLAADAFNTELLLHRAELLDAEAPRSSRRKGKREVEGKVPARDPVEAIEAVYKQAATTCPTPDVFHHQARFWLRRGAHNKAVAALEQGIEVFPEDVGLLCRLATLYRERNRLNDAQRLLRRALDLEPMMPDTYGLLGEILVQLGPDHWEEAEQYLAEARRLDPDNPHHLLREAEFLRQRSMVDVEHREELLERAEARLREATHNRGATPQVYALLATTLLDRDGDLDQVDWLLKKVSTSMKGPELLTQRARLAIRKGAWSDARNLLDRALRASGAYHPALAAMGELYLAEGDAFRALDAWQKARDGSPEHAPERSLYGLHIERCKVLIESRQAIAMMRSAEQAQPQAARAEGPRREPGVTVVRRKGSLP